MIIIALILKEVLNIFFVHYVKQKSVLKQVFDLIFINLILFFYVIIFFNIKINKTKSYSNILILNGHFQE